MDRKLTARQPPYTLLVANLTGGSDPSKGEAGNPVKARETLTYQNFQEIGGRGYEEGPATPQGKTPGIGTRVGLSTFTTPDIPVGATGTILVADGDFTAAAVLRLGNFELVSGDDFAAGPVQSIGSATVVAIPSTATLTLGGQTLTDAGGGRTPGSDDYDGTLGSVDLIAADIVAAINDVANGFVAIATAVDGGGGLINLTAVPAGTLGDAVTLVTSDAGDITVSGALFTGGVDSDDATATSLAAAIDALPGFSAPVPGVATITVTGPTGPGGNNVLFEATYTGTILNYTLTPADGSLGSGEPTIGPPAIN